MITLVAKIDGLLAGVTREDLQFRMPTMSERSETATSPAGAAIPQSVAI